MINNFEISNEGKVRLTSTLEFMSSKDTNEKHEMYISSINLEIMIGENTDEIITELFNFLFAWIPKNFASNEG